MLCEVGGESRRAAADRLGIPEGTVRSRLAKARKLLAARLRKRGVVLSAGVLAGAGLAAAVPPALAAAATALADAPKVPPEIAVLSNGVFRAMFLQKLKPAAVAGLLTVALTVGGGLIGWGDRAEGASPTVGTARIPASLPGADRPRPRGGADTAFTAARLAPAPRAGDVAKAVARFVEQLRARKAPRWPKANELGLFLMDLDKSDVTLIASATDEERAYCGSPSWSADGKRIYFDASHGFGNFAGTRLQMIESTDQGAVLKDLGPGNCPSASPDGKRIAYRRNGLPGPAIHVAKADGTLLYRLDGGFAKWSPDGRILLNVASFTNPSEFSLVTAASGEDKPTSLPDHRIYSVPSWVEEGTLIALIRSNQKQKFAVALLDTTDPEKMTVKETLWKRGDGTNVEPMYPVFSPARRRGVFSGREPNGQALYTFEPGKVPTRVEPKRRLDPKIASLALSPDGRYLLFCSARPGENE